MFRRWMTGSLALGLGWTLSGCPQYPGGMSPGMSLPSMPPPTTDAYSVDDRIAGKYGVEGEVAWVLNPGQRPSIIPLDAYRVSFKPGVTTEQADLFARTVGARILKRLELPAAPDGSVPAAATDTYEFAFEPLMGDLADFESLLRENGFKQRVIFSSSRAARTFYAVLKAKRLADQYQVKSIYLGPVGCIPEDCGIAPDDPYASSGSPVPILSPAPVYLPEPYAHQSLPSGRGTVYVVESSLYLEAPGQPTKKLVTVADRTSFVHVDPALRFVLLHERKTEMPVFDLSQIKPGMAKPSPGSRLVWQSLESTTRRVLIEHFYHYDIGVTVAPDGHSMVVRTQLEENLEGDGRRIYLLDTEAPGQIRPWLGSLQAYMFKWSPNGKMLAMIGSQASTPGNALYVASPDMDAPRLVKILERATGILEWMPDSERILTSGSDKMFQGVLHFEITRVADGASTTRELRLGDVGDVHVQAREMSPDGKRLLIDVMQKFNFGVAVVDLETGAVERLGTGARWPRWKEDGTLVCGSAPGTGDAPCP